MNSKSTLSRLLMLCVASSLLLSSCRTVYAPTAANVPLFQEKGEVRANLSLDNYQAAYAVSDNIGVMVNGQYRNSTVNITQTIGTNTTKDEILTTNKGVELGVGYFKNTKRFRVCLKIFYGKRAKIISKKAIEIKATEDSMVFS